ncbi:hypothetical protein [Enterococcus sp. AZ109]|uniref:hypothetical protein n=1 Tax=Enterococcus sp. AZ109 TaxID=2774634 RepID=UPI003F255126
MICLKELAEEMDTQFEEIDTFVHKKTGEFLYLDTNYYDLAEEVDIKEANLDNEMVGKKKQSLKLLTIGRILRNKLRCQIAMRSMSTAQWRILFTNYPVHPCKIAWNEQFQVEVHSAILRIRLLI